MNTAIDKKKHQWLWFFGLCLIGPVCLAVIDLGVRLLLALGFFHP